MPQPTATAPAPERRLSHPGLALAVICIAQLMVVLDATVVNVALAPIRKDLGFSQAGLEWVITAYSLAFGGLLLFGGRTGDLFGRRKMFLLGVGVFAAASLAGGLAQTEAMLIIARAAQGIGGAIAAPTALALIATTFAEGKERNRAFGVYAAMAASGGAVGLLVGGALTDLVSWRWSLFINVPIAAFVLIVGPRVLVESKGNGDKLDVPGAITATAGMTSIVYGISHAATHTWGETWTLVPLFVGIALLAAFTAIERRTAAPLLPFQILTARNRIGAYLIMLCLAAALFAVFFFSTQYLEDVNGWSPVLTGVGFLPMPLTIMALSMFGMRFLLPRVGIRRLLLAGPVFATAAMLVFSRLTVDSGYLGLLPGLILLALGMGCVFVPLTVSAVAGVHQRESGIASALLNTGQQLGGALGLSLLGTIFAHASRSDMADVVRDRGAAFAASDRGVDLIFVHGQHEAFYGATGFAALALLVSIVLMRTPKATTVAGGENIAAGLESEDASIPVAAGH